MSKHSTRDMERATTSRTLYLEIWKFSIFEESLVNFKNKWCTLQVAAENVLDNLPLVYCGHGVIYTAVLKSKKNP